MTLNNCASARILMPVSTSAEHQRLGIWLDTVGRMTERRHSVYKRSRPDLHLAFCHGGEGEFELGGICYPVSTGTVFFVPQAEIHSYRSNPETGWDLYWVHFHGRYAEQLAQAAGLSKQNPLVEVQDRTRILEHFEEMLELVQAKDQKHQYYGASCLLQILVELVAQSGSSPHAHGLVSQLTWQTRDVETAAEEAGMSKYHYIRCFREGTGTTPWQYILQLKVDKAKELLLNTGMNNSEIAGRLGFGDGNYFSQVFKKRVGQTPGAYRKAFLS